MASSMDSADMDLNDSGNWSARLKSVATLRKVDPKKKEQKRIKDDEKKRLKEEVSLN